MTNKAQMTAARKEIAKNSKLRSTRRKLHKFVNFCQSLKDLIPTRKDGTLLKTIKVLGIVDKVFPENKINSFKELGFKSANNHQFIAMISSLNLMDDFSRDSEEWDDRYSLGIYALDGVGSLILFEDDNRKFASDFYHSADFQFRGVAKVGWDKCKGCMEVEKQANGGWNEGYSFVYSPFTQHTGRQFGSSSQKLEDFAKRNAAYMTAGISRTYLFVGPPGVGKTTLAQKFAVTAYERILKMSANTLYEISLAALNDMIDMLDPQCMLIDEIDKDSYKMDWGNHRTGCSLLSLVEHLKLTYPHITIIFTANQSKYLHPAMLRPGRTDDIIEFDNPNIEDRKAIIEGYCEELGVDIDADGLEKMAACTDGLSGAWLKELVLKLRYEDAVHLSDTIEKMKRYAKEPKKEGDNNQTNQTQEASAEAKPAETEKKEEAANKSDEGSGDSASNTEAEGVCGPTGGGAGGKKNGNGDSGLLPRYFYPSVEETMKWLAGFDAAKLDSKPRTIRQVITIPANRPN